MTISKELQFQAILKSLEQYMHRVKKVWKQQSAWIGVENKAQNKKYLKQQ